MKRAGRSATYVFVLWTAIALMSGIASLLGYSMFSGFSKEVIAATEAVAAGAILAMIADTGA
jgi:ZIP family zinc transporter